MQRTRILQDDETGFALDALDGAFVLVDTLTGDDVEHHDRRDVALDSYERARREVRRDRIRLGEADPTRA